MTKKCNKKFLSLILSTMLIVAMAFSMTACGGKDTEKPNTEVENTESKVLGEGAVVFDFVVVDAEGKETSFEIHTDKVMVGDALLEVALIDGEDGDYGLYVKSVNGTTLDYDKDGMYWSFYINGEYAMTGVDVTPITEGETYMFKAEKS